MADPTGVLLSRKEIKCSAPRFPKVIMQSLATTPQERGGGCGGGRGMYHCIEVADDCH